jgi:hypothetical protein
VELSQNYGRWIRKALPSPSGEGAGGEVPLFKGGEVIKYQIPPIKVSWYDCVQSNNLMFA